jgi:uncharacterized membrane protein YagU involved in acid resistance
MTSIPAAMPLPQSKAAPAIVRAGLLAGALDITAACTYWYFKAGAPPERILKGIAGGVLTRAVALKGGWDVALLGLFLHFTIAFGAAVVYYLASRVIGILTTKPWIAGPLYGICVYLFMNTVVLPLSRIETYKIGNSFTMAALYWGVPVHMLCIGLPIAVMIAKYAPRTSA